jgi:hypothetical protein
VVVGVNRGLASQLSSHDLDSSVGDDLVDVHVGLCSRSSLEDDQGEVVEEFTRDDLVRGLGDGIGDLLVHTWKDPGRISELAMVDNGTELSTGCSP